MKKKIIGVLVCMLFVIGAILPLASTLAEPDVVHMSNSASVYTDKFIYRIGEPVQITIFNGGGTTINFGGPPWFNITKFSFLGFGWTHVYPKWHHLMLYFLDPGSSLSDTWDQEDLNGNQVSRGFYRVNVQYSANAPHTASDLFLIWLPP
jgi:hypothetical protein